MVYFIILQPISQVSREKIRPAVETIAADRRHSQPIAADRGASQPVWSVPFVNMGAERKEVALPGASQQIAADRSRSLAVCPRRKPDLCQLV